MRDNLIGASLGQYEILGLLGSGGMATVYRGYQPTLNRYVAVKVLPSHLLSKPKFSVRFRQEALTVARLEHPNILPVFDFGEANGVPFIVMPLVQGGTLRTRMRSRVPVEWAISTCGRVAQALDYAHRLGVVHRDVKPANVLLGPADWPLVSDFGIAEVLGETLGLTATGAAIGTPEYMSPEQCQGVPLDGRSDQYALAVVAFEMLAGRLPFVGDTPLAIIFRQIHDPVPDIHSIDAAIPSSAGVVLSRALSKRPEARFATCTEFAGALANAFSIAGPAPVPDGYAPIAAKLSAAGELEPESRTELMPAEAEAAAVPHGEGRHRSAGSAEAQPPRGPGRLGSLTRRKAVRLTAAAVAASGLIAWLTWIAVSLRWVAPPDPTPMIGDVNIVVAEFGSLSADGRLTSSDVARDLAQSFFESLSDELGSLRSGELAGIQIRVRPPNIPHLTGSTRLDRASEADKLALRINADLVVYGVIQLDKGVTKFAPEFYLSGRKLPGAEELAGQYEFGSVLEGPADLERNPVARKEVRDRLVARTRALAQFMVGLGYYTMERFDEAANHFQAAERTWDDCQCKEVLQIFLGDTAGKRGDLAAAETYYQAALRSNPDLARARFGVAETTFHRSRADCEASNVDVAGLYVALSDYQRTLAAADQSAYPTLSSKVALGLGRTYLCLSQALVADEWSRAEGELRKVIANFDGGNAGARELAAEAHAGLGLVYLPSVGDLDSDAKYLRARQEFETALGITRRPRQQAAYHAMLGFIHERLNEHERAASHYRRAAELDPARYSGDGTAGARGESRPRVPTAGPASN